MRLKTVFVTAIAGVTPFSMAAAADRMLLAEPIDYVSICEAHGKGFVSLPGTDACISIAGYSEFDAWFYDKKSVTEIGAPHYAAYWGFSNEADVNFTVKSSSDVGTIETYVELEVTSDDTEQDGHDKAVTLYSAYGTIGPFTFGYTDSIYAYPNSGYTLDGSINSDQTVDQVQWAKTWGDWGLAFALEDPRDLYSAPSNATGAFPDLALALTAKSSKTWDTQVSFAMTDRTTGIGWGAQLAGTYNFGKTASLRGIVAYSDNSPVYAGGTNCTGGCANEGVWWSTLLTGQYQLTKAFALQATGSYLQGPTSEQWQAALGGTWTPTTTTSIGFNLLYEDNVGADSLGFHAQLKTSFGPPS